MVGTKLGTLFPCRSDRSLANCLRGTPAPPPCTCTWSRAEKNLKIPEVDEILADTKGRYRVLFELLAGSVSVMVGLCCSFLSATPQIQGFHVAGKGGRHLRSPPIPEPFSQPLRASRPPAGSYCKRSRKRRAGAFWKPVPRVECCERDHGGGREGRKLAEAENTYETFIRLLNKDGRLNLKVARGYLDLLRQERPVPADFDLTKVVDHSLLPGSR